MTRAEHAKHINSSDPTPHPHKQFLSYCVCCGIVETSSEISGVTSNPSLPMRSFDVLRGLCGVLGYRTVLPARRTRHPIKSLLIVSSTVERGVPAKGNE